MTNLVFEERYWDSGPTIVYWSSPFAILNHSTRGTGIGVNKFITKRSPTEAGVQSHLWNREGLWRKPQEPSGQRRRGSAADPLFCCGHGPWWKNCASLAAGDSLSFKNRTKGGFWWTKKSVSCAGRWFVLWWAIHFQEQFWLPMETTVGAAMFVDPTVALTGDRWCGVWFSHCGRPGVWRLRAMPTSDLPTNLKQPAWIWRPKFLMTLTPNSLEMFLCSHTAKSQEPISLGMMQDNVCVPKPRNWCVVAWQDVPVFL